MMASIAVYTNSANKIISAKKMAENLQLAFITHRDQMEHYDYLLVLTEDYLGLQKTNVKSFKPFYIDFSSPKMIYRSQHAGLRKEMLARAIGISPSQDPIIVDATAGLGQDSFILASLGYEITLLERSPIIYALLADALTRGKTDDRIMAAIGRMNLHQTDAIAWLNSAIKKPHVIYLDPMFPAKQKSASSKKEMVILQDLLGKDLDSAELLKTALACASKRVVVKRPRLARKINDVLPDFSLQGKSSRFDIYLV